MSAWLRVVVLCGALVTAGSPAAFSQETQVWDRYLDRPRGPYRGQVVDAETKAPLAGAVVVVHWLRDRVYPFHSVAENYAVREAVTDAEGRFLLDVKDVEEGAPRRTRRPGFLHLSSWVWVVSEEACFSERIHRRHLRTARERSSNCRGSRTERSAESISFCLVTATSRTGRSRTFLSLCAESTRNELPSDSNHILNRSSHGTPHDVGNPCDRVRTVAAHRAWIRGPDACRDHSHCRRAFLIR